MSQDKKKKKKIRFFNRPVKIGLSLASVGLGLEFGSPEIASLLADYPTYIFWLEMAKIASYIVGVIFTGGGVFKQAKKDLESIKLGEIVKEGVKEIEELKAKPENTKKEESSVTSVTMDKVFNLAEKILNRKNKK